MKFSPPVIDNTPLPFGFGFGLLPIMMYGVIACSWADVKGRRYATGRWLIEI